MGDYAFEAPPTSKERIRHAQLSGVASGLKGLLNGDRERFEELRATWPELAERLDRVVELVDWG